SPPPPPVRRLAALALVQTPPLAQKGAKAHGSTCCVHRRPNGGRVPERPDHPQPRPVRERDSPRRCPHDRRLPRRRAGLLARPPPRALGARQGPAPHRSPQGKDPEVKTLVKALVALCFVGWAAHNPAQVQADVGRVMSAGQSLVSSLMNAGGSALSGVTGG